MALTTGNKSGLSQNAAGHYRRYIGLKSDPKADRSGNQHVLCITGQNIVQNTFEIIDKRSN